MNEPKSHLQLCPNTLACIAEHVEAISDAYLDRFARSLTPVGESDVPLGTLHDVGLRRVWCASSKLYGLAEQEKAKIRIVDTVEEHEVCKEQFAKYIKLAGIAMALFWAEVRDFGSAWSAANVGVRLDWMVVKTQEADGEDDGSNALAKWLRLLGGE